MPAPTPNWGLATITGKYVSPEGVPLPTVYPGQCDLIFTLAADAVDAPAKTEVVASVTVLGTLDNTGNIVLKSTGGALQLPTTDDPDITPTGLTWQVQQQWPGGKTFSFEVPSAAVGGVLDLTLVQPVTPQPVTITYATIAWVNSQLSALALQADLTVVADTVALTQKAGPSTWTKNSTPPTHTPIDMTSAAISGTYDSFNAASTDAPLPNMTTFEVITSGTALTAILKKTGITAIDLTAKVPFIVIKLSTVGVTSGDVWNLNGFRIDLANDAALANRYSWEIKESQTIQNHVIPGDGTYYLVPLPWSQATTSGTPTKTGITAWQIRLTDFGTGAKAQVNIASFGLYPEKPKAQVVLTFDDSYASHTYAAAEMYKRGMLGTFYTINDYIGVTGRLTETQLLWMQRCGHEIAAHSPTGTLHAARFTSLTGTALKNALRQAAQELRDKGLMIDTIAYPGGIHNAEVQKNADELYLGARTVFATGDYLGINKSKIRSHGYATASLTLTAMKARYDLAKANKETFTATWHDLVTGTLTAPTDWAQTDFTAFLDYIAADIAAGTVEVKTMRAALT